MGKKDLKGTQLYFLIRQENGSLPGMHTLPQDANKANMGLKIWELGRILKW